MPKISEKDVLSMINSEQVALFHRSERKKITVYPSSWIPSWVTFSFANEAITMTKESYKLDNGNQLEFVFHTNHAKGSRAPEINQQTAHEPAETFVWHTTQANIREAIFNGVMNVQAPTAKVINELGKYRLAVYDRIYVKGIISNKYTQKEAFLKLTQERIETLQGLERLINNYDHGSTINENVQRINIIFEEYVKDLKTLKDNYKKHTDVLTKYDRDACSKIENQIDTDIAKANKFRNALQRLSSEDKLSKESLDNNIFAAAGRTSIMTFVRERMVYAIRQLQEHNQNMTYSYSAGSILRGDINSTCEDALKIIFDYQADQHNLILPEHQGRFSSNANDERTVDFSHFDLSATEKRHALMAIAQIEQQDKIVPTTVEKDSGYQEYVLKSNGDFKPLYTSRFTKWATNSSVKFIAKRIAAWFWNVLSGIVIGVVLDFWWGFIGGVFNFKTLCLADRVRWEVKNERNIHTKFHEMEAKVKLPMQSLGTKLGKLIGNFIRNTFVEFFRGFRIVIREAKVDLLYGIKSDYNIGHKGIPDEIDIIETVEQELNELKTEFNNTKAALVNEMQRYEKQATEQEQSITKEQTTDTAPLLNGQDITDNVVPLHPFLISQNEAKRICAITPYDLSHGEWYDILNSITNGLTVFLESFTHEIHTKHPFTGVVFSTMYLAGGAVIFAPAKLAFLGTKYHAFSETIGASTGKSTVSKAISSAWYQGMAAAGTLNFVLEGTESWFANGIKAMEDDPANLVIYGGIAYGLGALIAYGLNIPYISHEVRSDLGYAPFMALMFAGLKVGILLYELLEADPTKEEYKETELEIRAKLKLIYNDTYKGENTLTDNQIETAIDELLSKENLKNLKRLSEDARRTNFIMNLERNKELVPHLHHSTKRNLLELVTQQYPDNPEMRNAMSNMLFPKSNHSILAVTLSAILGYIPMIMRCLLTAITWSKEPWRHLWDKLKKDLGRLAYLISRLWRMVVNFVKVGIRIFCDIFINEIVARLEGLIRNNKHSVSRGSYFVSSGYDASYITISETLGTPVDLMKKASTGPHADKLVRHHITNTRLKDKSKAMNTADDYQHFEAAKDIDFKELRKSIRAKLSDKSDRIDYYRNESLFDSNGLLDANNNTVKALRGNRFNYELIRDLIVKNNLLGKNKYRYSPSQISQLMLLDKTGRVAIDLLNLNYANEISDRLFTDPQSLSNIIQNFYHNHHVMNAIRIDTNDDSFLNRTREGIKHDFDGICFCYDKRNNGAMNYFNQALFKIVFDNCMMRTPSDNDINQTLHILRRLLLTQNTQRATYKYLMDDVMWKKCLTHNSVGVEHEQLEFRNLINELAEDKRYFKNLNTRIEKIETPTSQQSMAAQ